MSRIPTYVLLFIILLNCSFAEVNKAQEVWNAWAKQPERVWKYGEGNYSPLGFNPAIDAFLKDPFFMPRYGKDIEQVPHASLAATMESAWRFSGYMTESPQSCEYNLQAPQKWQDALGTAAEPAYNAWRCFLSIRRDVKQNLSGLPVEDVYIKQHYREFFFSKEEPNVYDFFTADSLKPFYFYTLSRKIDLAQMARDELRLAAVAEYLVSQRRFFEILPPKLNFTWEEEGAKLVITGTGNDIHHEDVDMLIDAGGNDIYTNNAGGTAMKFPAALAVDFSGNDSYQGKIASQGAGVLGIGLLVDLEGNDNYYAEELSQGAGFFGSGALWDGKGNDNYVLRWFGQGAATFGTGVLFDQSGNDHYFAHGMAQGAASTSGAGWLIDREGVDAYKLGDPNHKGWDESMGIGQGGAVGTRFYPWKNAPSLYGGLGVLIDEQGNDSYDGAWFSQGSGYFLSAGILVDKDGNDVYSATVDSQGQGLHLAAGLLLDEAGNDTYLATWGSQGTAGDLSAGILIDAEDNDVYMSGEHNLGTSRKPYALGVLFDGGGNDSYVYGSGVGNIIPPDSPMFWPRALFLDFAGFDYFANDKAEPLQKQGTEWGNPPHSVGMDVTGEEKGNWLESLPKKPRKIGIPYNSTKGWLVTGSFEKANAEALPDIEKKDYAGARKALEVIDLIRFSHDSHEPIIQEIPAKLMTIINDPERYNQAAKIFALQYFLETNDPQAADSVMENLKQGKYKSSWSKSIALEYLGSTVPEKSLPLIASYLQGNESVDVQWRAALIVAHFVDEQTLPVVKEALNSTHDEVRYAALKGLGMSKPQNWKDLVEPLTKDANTYISNLAKELLHPKQE